MTDQFLNVLKRHESSGALKTKEDLSRGLDDACLILAGLLSTYSPEARRDLLAQVMPAVLNLLDEFDELAPHFPTILDCPGLPSKYSQELLEWARQQFSEEEFVAGLDEIRETGGRELRDFIQELEKEAAPHE